jgi:hypothetical protein
LGGPLLNLIIAGAVISLRADVRSGLGADILASIISTSLFMGVGGFAPLPSVDGQVIWREVFRGSLWRPPQKV